MFMNKLKTMMLLLLALGGVAFGGLLTQHMDVGQQAKAEQKEAARQTAAKTDTDRSGGLKADKEQRQQIERKITKEPAYKSKPKYCLLVFGPEAKTRVWLVQDGDTLYVDRNGNGDLTEAGEKVAANRNTAQDSGESSYVFEVGDLQVGGKTHKDFTVIFEPLVAYARTLENDATLQAALK